MLVGEFIKTYLQDNFVKSLQTTGGFALKSLDKNTLSNLQVENVYERLGCLSQNNIVAVSECIKGPEHPQNVVYNMLSKFKNISIHGCDKDTGFVIDSKDVPITVTEVSYGCSVLNFDGIKIASVHLPGDGPNAKEQTIKEFLDENLTNLKSHDVDVILGDTNITDSKSTSKNRKKELNDYFTDFFDGPCVVIMSNARVGKHRRGFILRNQQLKKSVPESFNYAEADGTIMVIKLKKELIYKDKLGLDLLSNLPRFISTDVVNALEFRTKPNECLNEIGQPIESVWLDHSVLFISMKQLCSLIDKPFDPLYPRNLIVVNMGSIVNAGHKSWNTKYIPHQALINEYDRKFYEIIRNYEYSHNRRLLPEYENIIGSSMISGESKGVDMIEIYKDEDKDEDKEKMKEEIKKILDELKKKLEPYKTKYLKYKTKYLQMKYQKR
jgi:hypothetical protein